MFQSPSLQDALLSRCSLICFSPNNSMTGLSKVTWTIFRILRSLWRLFLDDYLFRVLYKLVVYEQTIIENNLLEVFISTELMITKATFPSHVSIHKRMGFSEICILFLYLLLTNTLWFRSGINIFRNILQATFFISTILYKSISVCNNNIVIIYLFSHFFHITVHS